jgi:polyisoprenoid-binding protein YceI
MGASSAGNRLSRPLDSPGDDPGNLTEGEPHEPHGQAGRGRRARAGGGPGRRVSLLHVPDVGLAAAGGAATPDGTWQVSDDGASYVGYRVREQLAFLSSPNEAVGRSTAVTGTMTVTGDTVEAARIEADLTRLTSDKSRRDNAIRQRGLESERFPTATLELAGPIRMAEAPVQGQEVRGQGKGRLTVHGVTRQVDLDLRGRWNGSTIQVVGQLPVRMSDYQIEAPRFGPVVSIEDSLAVDFNLVFERT